jgi:enoyl-CoA hydratase/carnithine racemase
VSDTASGGPLIQLERRDDGVAVVRLDNGTMNTLSEALLTQLRATALELTDDPPGAVVVTGGERAFAAGAEITEFLDHPDDRPSPVRSADRLAAYG